MIDYSIKSNVLDEMICRQRQQLQDLLRLRGQRYDPATELCKEFGISKRDLAAGLVFASKGNITIVELARRLSISRRTVYRWSEIVRALKAL